MPNLQAGTAIRLDNVEFVKGASGSRKIIITVRNTGSASATIGTVYVNDAVVTVTGTKVIATGTAEPLTYTYDWIKSTVYKIKVVTDNGFPAEASYTSPTSET